LARSVHTEPLRIRARRRAGDPFARRGKLDARLERAARRRLKALGLLPSRVRELEAREPRLPRVVVHAPRPGHRHAVAKTDVEAFLLEVGASAFYGVETIELARGDDSTEVLALGRFEAPGRIRLFDVPESPWRCVLSLARVDVRRLERAGAQLTRDERGALLVSWTDDALRELVLRDVLLHELGHHVLQHHAGQRRIAAARARDHEAFAELFAERTRRRLDATKGGSVERGE